MIIIDEFKKRKVWVMALIATLLGPTIAMFLLNKGRLGIIFFSSTIILASLTLALTHYEIVNFDIVTALVLIVIGMRIIGLISSIIIAKTRKQTPPKLYAKWHVILLFLIITYTTILSARHLLFETFHTPAGSMSPNIEIGDYFVARKFLLNPKKGDLVLFKNPKRSNQLFVKRIIGTPKDVIQMKEGQLYINGIKIPKESNGHYIKTLDDGSTTIFNQFIETLPNGHRYKILDMISKGPFDNTAEYKVPDDHYFVLGDNRDNSLDSRALPAMGYIWKENIIGIAIFSIWNYETGKLKYQNLMP